MDRQNLTTEDILNKDILELMGAQDMPEEKKQELYQKMMETVQNRVITKVADDMLQGQDLEKFKQLAEAQNKPELEEFLKSKGINLSKLMLQEVLLYKTEMTELSKTIQQAAQK